MFKDNPKLKVIFFAGFILSLHIALTAYINSSFLATLLPEKLVSFVYVLGFIVSILALLLIPKMLRKIGIYKLLLGAIVLDAASLFLMATSGSPGLVISVFIIYLALNCVIYFALDELLEIFSKNSGIGKMRGLYVVILSSAWIVSQSVSASILGIFSFAGLYILSFFIMCFLFILSSIFLKNLPEPEYDKEPISESLKIFFKNKNLSRSFKMNFLLQFFYAFMVIYTPLYLNAHLGFTWREIGIIFAIMLIPFLILPFYLGKYSDKIGERKLLLSGFVFMSLSTLALFFATVHNVWIWAFLLLCTRIGASTVETMCDVYFFKHIESGNDELIGIYRNANPVAYIIAPLTAFLIFSLTPAFNFIYLFLGAFTLYGVGLALSIDKKDI